jgi:hypothetical protein
MRRDCCICGGGTTAVGPACGEIEGSNIASYPHYVEVTEPDVLESVPDMFEILTSGCANTSPCIVLKDQCDDTSVNGGNCPLPGHLCSTSPPTDPDCCVCRSFVPQWETGEYILQVTWVNDNFEYENPALLTRNYTLTIEDGCVTPSGDDPIEISF